MDLDAVGAASRADPSAARADDLRVDELVAPNANPIMRAAGPLLLLLGRLRVALLRASFASLMEQVADAIKFFEKDIRSAGIPEQQANSREIHSLRHRRRHRPEHPDRRPPRLDAVQHAQPLLRRAHRRRALLRGARPALKRPADQLRCWNCSTPAWRSASRACTAPRRAAPRTLQQIQRNLYETLRRVRPKVDA